MVSLNDNRLERDIEEENILVEDANNAIEGEELIGHCTVNINEQEHYKIRTIWLSIGVILILLCLATLEFLIPSLCDGGTCSISDISSLALLQVAVWCAILVIDQFYRLEHKRIRQHGYLIFYRQTKVLKRVPLIIFTLGNACFLLLLLFFNEFCLTDESCKTTYNVSRIRLVQGLLLIEITFSLIFVIVYIAKVDTFHRQKLPPDIHNDDLTVSYSHLSIPDSEIGYRNEESSNDLIERQGDYIRYLKQHNENLGKKLLLLANELKALKTVQV